MSSPFLQCVLNDGDKTKIDRLRYFLARPSDGFPFRIDAVRVTAALSFVTDVILWHNSADWFSVINSCTILKAAILKENSRASLPGFDRLEEILDDKRELSLTERDERKQELWSFLKSWFASREWIEVPYQSRFEKPTWIENEAHWAIFQREAVRAYLCWGWHTQSVKWWEAQDCKNGFPLAKAGAESTLYFPNYRLDSKALVEAIFSLYDQNKESTDETLQTHLSLACVLFAIVFFVRRDMRDGLRTAIEAAGPDRRATFAELVKTALDEAPIKDAGRQAWQEVVDFCNGTASRAH